jgi:DcaP outer membrane protein
MRRTMGALALVAAVLLARGVARAEEGDKAKISLYGFAMLDMGYDFNQNDPDWFDVMRPTKLPAFDNEFGQDGRFYSGVRQSRLGVKSWIPTNDGEVYTIFEFELFGTGVDAGQTTFRLRHAYGQWKQIGAGQTWSPFMDPDVFPNSIEYWGPNGMVFFRNVQFRWMPMQGDNALTLALERPGASGSGGVVNEFVASQGIQGRFPSPDVTGNFRMNRKWGHLQFAGILRYIKWDDNVPDAFDLSGDTLGWGINVSTNVKFLKSDVLRASIVYGEGIENYMNDAPADVGVESNFGNAVTPVKGKALPVLGIVAFYDHTWNEKMTSTIGYSRVDIDNSDLQAPDEFHVGQYALANLLFYPVKPIMFGPEIQWARRENNSDGFSVDDFRIQFSAKFTFGHTWGGQ